MFTAQQVIDAVREETGDDLEPYRWTDAVLLTHLAAGLAEIFSRRPDAAYVTGIVVECPAAPAAVSDRVPLLDRFRQPLVFWVASRAIAKDAENGDNDRKAQALMAQFAGGLS